MGKQYYAPVQQETGTCYCPVCTGLKCLERPRFIPGQLLSDTDLNDQLSYLLAKNRLHNRYLHGWGVVCGLEVVCSDCAGIVTVKPGYALDPCGNDIIVCEEQDFNLMARIREICAAKRRQQRTDCIPARPPAKEICKEVEQVWCITLRYKEQEARPVTALRGETKTSCCHSSQDGTSATPANTAAVKSGIGRTIAACEPSRIFETYELDACLASPGMCLFPHYDQKKGLMGNDKQIFGDETMVGRFFHCLMSMVEHLTKRAPVAHFANLAMLSLTKKPIQDVGNMQQYQIYGSVLQAVLELYEADPFNTRCALPETLSQLICPQPGADEAPQEYIIRLYQPVMNVFALLLQYVIDCICKAIMPPCPVDPGDDAVTLACVTVQGDKIIRICNFCRRNYAGSFPAKKYWFSFSPLIWYLVEWFCCRPEQLRAQSPLVNELTNWFAKVDSDGAVRKALAEGGFALPRMYMNRVKGIFKKTMAFRPIDAIRPNGINLALMTDQPLEVVRQEMAKDSVTIVEQEVQSKDDINRLQNLTLKPFAAPGSTVVAYKLGGKVIGYGPYKPTSFVSGISPGTTQGVGLDNEMLALRTEVAELRAEIDALRKTRQNKP